MMLNDVQPDNSQSTITNNANLNTGNPSSVNTFVGASAAAEAVRNFISQEAQRKGAALIEGENGTGKVRVAKMIHAQSSRNGVRARVIDCAQASQTQVETEIFVGSGTGATTTDVGTSTTVILKSVESLGLSLQAKLVNSLNDLNVKIVAISNAYLSQMATRGEFNAQLYAVLSRNSIRLPNLRDRRSDIGQLVDAFIAQFNRTSGGSVSAPSSEIMTALSSYDWPGNVRELQNLIERIVILKGQGPVDLGDLPHRIVKTRVEISTAAASAYDFPRMVLPTQGCDLKEIVSAFENHLIDQALSRTSNNKNRASELLTMNRTTLVEKLRKRGMIVPAANKKNNEANESVINNNGELPAEV